MKIEKQRKGVEVDLFLSFNKASQGKNDNYSGRDSAGNSPVSIEENEFIGSPYKNAKISPFAYQNQSDSIHNPSPLNFFSSPIPKVMVTEAIKIGSARKVKDPALFVSDGTLSMTDNIRGGIVGTPPKVENLFLLFN